MKSARDARDNGVGNITMSETFLRKTVFKQDGDFTVTQ
jgi:hypothetical protein